jgi:hypothetical protein
MDGPGAPGDRQEVDGESPSGERRSELHRPSCAAVREDRREALTGGMCSTGIERRKPSSGCRRSAAQQKATWHTSHSRDVRQNTASSKTLACTHKARLSKSVSRRSVFARRCSRDLITGEDFTASSSLTPRLLLLEGHVGVAPDVLKLAEQILKSTATDFNPLQFVDHYEQALIEIPKKKQAAIEQRGDRSVNLMDA